MRSNTQVSHHLALAISKKMGWRLWKDLPDVTHEVWEVRDGVGGTEGSGDGGGGKKTAPGNARCLFPV